jgi:hypothetical protein
MFADGVGVLTGQSRKSPHGAGFGLADQNIKDACTRG